MTVADYSSGPISASALRAAGITGVVRYATLGGSSKRITKSEFASLHTGGIDIGVVAEQAARTLASASWDAAAAARAMRADCASLGHSGAVYQPVDWDIQSSEWPRVRDKLHQIIGVLGLARTGLYGPYDALTWAARDLGITLLWQSMSTGHSGGRNKARHPKAVLWQRKRSTVGGHTVDLNDVLSPKWGQTPAAVIAPAQNIEEDDVLALLQVKGTGPIYATNGITRRWVRTSGQLATLQWEITQRWHNGTGKIISCATAEDLEAIGGVLVGPDPQAQTADGTTAG